MLSVQYAVFFGHLDICAYFKRFCMFIKESTNLKNKHELVMWREIIWLTAEVLMLDAIIL